MDMLIVFLCKHAPEIENHEAARYLSTFATRLGPYLPENCRENLEEIEQAQIEQRPYPTIVGLAMADNAAEASRLDANPAVTSWVRADVPTDLVL
jgi:hypothetical protein